MLRASSIEVNKLEKRVTFLATTASITPFIGLFGTVWGIMTAFMNIGAQGSTDLAVVSTPIAEALIATALGLVRGDSGRLLLQPLHLEGEGLRVGDGRLRARVPQHLGKELHLVPKVMSQPDANTGRRRGRRVTTSLSEINVIPLVDVMLVLLIIFMVAAPMMQKGVEVNLPVSRRADKMTNARAALRDGPGILSNGSSRVHRSRRRFRSTCSPSACGRRCRPGATSRSTCAATATVQLQELMDVFGRLKEAGVEKIGIVAQERQARNEIWRCDDRSDDGCRQRSSDRARADKTMG